jgi:RimJ/RimL family protein N-acetyltransferase
MSWSVSGGIGTEAARACVEFARKDLEITKLVALIIPENIGFIKVAEKLGMTRGPLIHIYDKDLFQYELML